MSASLHPHSPEESGGASSHPRCAHIPFPSDPFCFHRSHTKEWSPVAASRGFHLTCSNRPGAEKLSPPCFPLILDAFQSQKLIQHRGCFHGQKRKSGHNQIFWSLSPATLRQSSRFMDTLLSSGLFSAHPQFLSPHSTTCFPGCLGQITLPEVSKNRLDSGPRLS